MKVQSKDKTGAEPKKHDEKNDNVEKTHTGMCLDVDVGRNCDTGVPGVGGDKRYSVKDENQDQSVDELTPDGSPPI